MRVALGIEYAGTGYNGWQRQKTGTGVQSLVERALAQVADHPVETICAGRTDTGVHAFAQVIHFDSTARRSERGWLLGVNSNLPDDINVSWAAAVNEDFHARFGAVSRTYRYLILNRLARSSLMRHRAWWVHEPLNEESMQTAANYLLGEHDFSAFRAAGCQAATPVRTLFNLHVERFGDLIAITVAANAFLQHMVRNLSGMLVMIGRGDAEVDWARAVLDSRDRTAGGIAAPPHGLTLIDVEYPAQFNIPRGADPGVHPQSARIRL